MNPSFAEIPIPSGASDAEKLMRLRAGIAAASVAFIAHEARLETLALQISHELAAIRTLRRDMSAWVRGAGVAHAAPAQPGMTARTDGAD